MGISFHYQAIPPASSFYQRLHQDRELTTLLGAFVPYGCGIFNFFEIDAVEIDEILEWVMEQYPDIFDSRSTLDRWVREYRQELEQTQALYPGIAGRSTSLEKCVDKIYERLIRELEKSQERDIRSTVAELIYDGDQNFAPDLLSNDILLWSVSARLVQKGAELLRGITPDMLFTATEDKDDWYRPQFEWWKDLYLATAENNEEMIITMV
jgi:hypothetical protein